MEIVNRDREKTNKCNKHLNSEWTMNKIKQEQIVVVECTGE